MKTFTRKFDVFIVLFFVCGFYPVSAQNGSLNEVPFSFPTLERPSFKDKIYDIGDYGAKSNDTLHYNTDAINSAISECSENGGGMVYIPKGVWLTGPIHLKSNVNLHLERHAELRFSQNYEDYLPVVLIQRGGSFCYNYSPLIYAIDCNNIAITGSGVLNGRGQVWWNWSKNQPGMTRLFKMSKNGTPIEQRIFGTEKDGVRPPFIQFLSSKDIYIQGVTIKDGPSWNIHPVFCENIIIRNIKILSPDGPNNDGIDIDGCKNVLIEDCYIDAGDDAICLKSGRDEEAWEFGKRLENVIIRRCITKNGHGGFVIGSEMSSGVKNVLVEDCFFDGTSRGLRFKSQIGRGGVVENIWIKDIKMTNIISEAIRFNLFYFSDENDYEEFRNAPMFKDIYIENINCEGAKTAIEIVGLPGGDYLKNIYFKNINIKAKNGIIGRNMKNINMENMNITN